MCPQSGTKRRFRIHGFVSVGNLRPMSLTSSGLNSSGLKKVAFKFKLVCSKKYPQLPCASFLPFHETIRALAVRCRMFRPDDGRHYRHESSATCTPCWPSWCCTATSPSSEQSVGWDLSNCSCVLCALLSLPFPFPLPPPHPVNLPQVQPWGFLKGRRSHCQSLICR